MGKLGLNLVMRELNNSIQYTRFPSLVNLVLIIMLPHSKFPFSLKGWLRELQAWCHQVLVSQDTIWLSYTGKSWSGYYEQVSHCSGHIGAMFTYIIWNGWHNNTGKDVMSAGIPLGPKLTSYCSGTRQRNTQQAVHNIPKAFTEWV